MDKKWDKVPVQKCYTAVFLPIIKRYNMASLSSINIKFGVDLREFSTEMQTALKSIVKAGEEMKSLGSTASLYITAPILAAAGAAIKFASDYEESLNKVDVAFGSSSKYVQEFADTTLETYGIAKGTALDMASLFGDMATSMGLPQQEAAKMSTSLVGLAGDLSSFKNIGVDEAMTALNGIFTGETESLKRIGVIMTDANLQAYAYSKGINTLTKNMSQAEKVQLRYGYILDNTKNSQGDFANTSDGAANQMRIFQEVLKQIGQQIGAVILPVFTKFISLVNGVLKSFSNLSDATKTIVVVIGAVVASIGPLLFALGSVLTLAPTFVAGFVAMKTAFATFTAFVAANPLGAIAVAIGLIVASLYAYNAATADVVKSGKLLNEVQENATKSIAKEKAELDTLIKVAQDEKRSKEEREAAIKKLNAISPEYLGNLKLDTINTTEAKNAIEKYNEALNQKALQQAILTKKTELYQQKVALLNKDLSFTGNVFSDSAQKASNFIFSLLGVETQTIRNKEELEKYIKTSKLDQAQAAAVRDSYKTLIQERDKDVKAIDNQINALDGYGVTVEKSNNLVEDNTDLIIANTEAKKKSFQAGTIAFYEAEIAKLQQLQKENSKTMFSYFSLQKQINGFQKLIDEIAVGEIKAIEIEPIKNEDYLASWAKTQEVTAGAVSFLQYQQNLLLENGNAFNEGLTQIMETAGQTFAVGFGEMIGQSLAGGLSIQSVWTLMIGTLADMAIQIGKVAIGIGIAVSGIKKALTSLNPVVAIAAGVALIALGTFAKSALSSISNSGTPAFANGGVVGGSSFVGDKILARVNSGELILNNQQQGNLWGMMNQGGGDNYSIELGLGTRISGSDLDIVIERAIRKNNRKG